MRRFLAFLSVLLMSATGAMAEPRAEMVIVEQDGCAYCALWNRQIASIYPKTDVGAAAPLRRIDLHDPIPEDLSFARRVNFTPTFILVIDGVEVSRLEGYPGEDFFWGLVERMSAEQGLIVLPPAG